MSDRPPAARPPADRPPGDRPPGDRPPGDRPPGDRARDRAGRREDDEPVLPDTTRDERDVGWGDEPGRRDDDWYRRQRPPHHE